jgi:hypothetical protein
MKKLYKFTDSKKEYWQTWDRQNGSHIVHWGILGTEGESKVIEENIYEAIEKEIDEKIKQGFHQAEDEFIVLIEFKVDGFGTAEDLEKRNRLQDRMDETLGWTGLGFCDGGSIGSGTMEVCNIVVDAELAMQIIEKDLKGTEFENYTRIFLED